MRLANTLLYLFVTALFNLLGRFPRARIETIAAWLGTLLFKLDRRHRRVAVANLTQVFGKDLPPHRIQTIARKVFINLWRIVFEIGWSRTLRPTDYRNYFTFSGLDAYQRAEAKGKGVLMLCAHFGNWELLPIIAHMTRMPVEIVYRPLDAPFLERFIRENRCRFGAGVIAKDRGAMRKIIRALHRRKAVAMLMDQDTGWRDGVFVNFFGRPAFTSGGMALLAVRMDTPVVPVFLIRTPAGFHAVFGPELPLIRTGDPTKDIELNTEQYSRVIEIYARRFPEQWFWVHERWKNLPYRPWPRIVRSKKKQKTKKKHAAN